MTFRWNKRRIKAAELVADDGKTNEQIASDCGVIRQTLDQWKRSPEFAARVKSILDDNRQKLRAEGLTNKQNRLDDLNDAHERLTQVIAERAADSTMATVPGGTTGLIVRRWHQVETPDGKKSVPEYSVDVGTLKERRETAKQAAQELGQWTDRQDVTSGGKPLIDLDRPITVTYVLPVEDGDATDHAPGDS